MTVSARPDKITTNRLVASGSGKLKFILGAAGCTRIDVNGNWSQYILRRFTSDAEQSKLKQPWITRHNRLLL
jgi:hypothetical protein